MPAPTGPIRLAAYDNTPYLDMIAINTSLNPDFTNTAGPTGGWCARGLYVEGNGNIAFYGIGAPGLDGVTPTPTVRVITVGDKVFIPVAVASIDNTNTNATGIFACL